MDAEIKVIAKGMETDLQDHMGLLAMGLCKGDTVEIRVWGNNEEEVCEELVELFERNFDFPPRK
jgi:phosphotransferase system HPr (HPr) family protein